MSDWKLSLKDLEDAGACAEGMATYFARAGQAKEATYTDGWKAADALRVYNVNPRHLRWLERRGLVPIVEFPGGPSVTDRQADKASWESLKVKEKRRGR